MGLDDFKKRWSSNTSRKFKDIVSDTEAPSPIVPMDSRRVVARGERHLSAHSAYATPNFSKHVDRAPTPQRKENERLPTSPSFEDEANSASGEPLFQYDFPHRSVPKEFKPYTITRDFAAEEAILHSKKQALQQVARSRMDLQQERQPRAQTPVRSVQSRDSTPTPSRTLQDSMSQSGDLEVPAVPTLPKDVPSSSQGVPPTQDVPPPQDVASLLDPQHDSDRSSNSEASKFASSGYTNGSVKSFDTTASSFDTSHSLPALQAKSAIPDGDYLEPVLEDDPASFDLVLPTEGETRAFQLEDRSEQMFSREHLQEIFNDTPMLLQFTNFLSSKRPRSIPLLVYYLDALKALRAIKYANAIAEALSPIEGYEFSDEPTQLTTNSALEERAKNAFDALVKDDLPAFITHTFIKVVSVSIHRRVTGTLPPHLREASEGLAEVFCLTDPSRQDNPIVFASEEFHRTTQYGVSYAIGRNCRFLQGPRTNKYSVERLAKAIAEQRETSEVFLNYRRDGSPFMNLLMCAPLLDSRGKTRYFIGAQVDVSGLCKEGTDLAGLQRLISKKAMEKTTDAESEFEDEYEDGEKDSFEELAEMFNETELHIVRRRGGNMHREQVDENEDSRGRSERPRLLIKELSDPSTSPKPTPTLSARNGKLEGIYQNYLLVRPYPSLRILFCSPSLRVPGILQSPFMNRIGGSPRVRDTLTAALAEGRGVTAKVRWIAGKNQDEGRARWIHCTPLLGQNGVVGVWMIVLVEDETTNPQRRYKQAPPVEATIPKKKSSHLQFDPPTVPSTLRRINSQDAIHRGLSEGDSPKPGSLYSRKSLESFTIDPA